MVAASKAPDGWTPERLGSLGSWLSGGTPSMSDPDYWGGDIPWVSPKDMKRSRLWDSIDHVTSKALGRGTRLAPTNALLLVVRGMILAHSFPVARAETPLAFNQDIKGFVARYDVDSEYLLWWLTAHEALILGVTTESTHGTKRLSTDALHGVEINLPPLLEQHAIASALNDIDALLGGLDRLIAKKRCLKQASIQQLLTGRMRLTGFDSPWKERQLRDVIANLAAGVSVNSVDAEVSESGDSAYVLKTSAVVNGQFFPREAKKIATRDLARARLTPRQDALIISRMNTPELVGQCGYVVRNYPSLYIPDRLWMTQWKTDAEISPRWLAYQLTTPGLRRKIGAAATGTSGSMKNLSKRAFLDITLTFPPVQEQIAIATVLSDMDAELSALEARRKKTRDLKQAMMQELLTGRTRLL